MIKKHPSDFPFKALCVIGHNVKAAFRLDPMRDAAKVNHKESHPAIKSIPRNKQNP